ncbi:MAG TPA: Bcr/CflA family multidrug efflux MFS transporter [Candidatus Pseudomonas excrementavium]|uniref:Bcr/CflA family multidrug efflux MFS transporter n=1 Tax=Halopseudomonas bauzanensis TaxID=653930 RepID=UPI001C3A675C|nr:Bcr/CflA family multidrug efflux MFS transporter [Halopseudomonas bauzanensis]HIZ51235.1 Bcr/CflA family multidrug efflux MFS transporter [Candidatus Pseudomonas excrementavium]
MTLRLLLILGGLSAFGPLAIDLYLPAFPAIAQFFETDSEHVQLSLSAYFIGLAIGQLFYGPLADRFGRRKPLLFGIGLFTLASIGCALAPTLEWLIVARFAQALGGCAGMVVNRAVVRDICTPIEAARAFSQLMLVMGVAPILAPLAGGWLMLFGGWQLIFAFLATFAGVFGFLVFFRLPETLPQHVPPSRLSSALGRYGRLLKEPQFMFHALTGGIAMAGMFAYIAGSPFVFIELYGVPVEHYGWFFGMNSAGFVLSAQFNSRLLRRRTPLKLLKITTLLFMGSTLALSAVALFEPPSLWPLLVPLFMCMALLALVLPNSSACALAGHGHQAGVASALMGTLQFTIAGIVSALVGALHNGTALPMTGMISVCGVAAATMALLARRATPAEVAVGGPVKK